MNEDEKVIVGTIGDRLSVVEQEITMLRKDVSTLLGYVEGLLNGIGEAKKQKGMVGMFAGMLPDIPKIGGN